MNSLLQSRRPLSSRAFPNSPSKTRVISGGKRPRSPEKQENPPQSILKRFRSTHGPVARDLQKERKTEREQMETEFREKYTRAFPTWKFYFDTEKPMSISQSSLRTRVLQLGATIVDFFDTSVTHVISDAEIPRQQNLNEMNVDKENHQTPTNRTITGRKTLNRVKEEKKNVAIRQAMASRMKIWSAVKLDSVLSRCLNVPTSREAPTSQQRPTLLKLLQEEKIHGTTERDPTEKRHNYHYFTSGSCFVLIEDINQELATIAAHEYPIVKNKDPNSKKPWPVLHCHPHSRNPFAPFDEKEKRRWARQQKAEKDEEEERLQRQRRRQLEAIRRRAENNRNGCDLRRSVSLNNIQRQFTMEDCVDLDADGDDFESANASGYLASGAGAGYVAASGDSVGITSTTGTTSSAQGLRNLKLPTSMNDRIKHQVVTNLKVSVSTKEKDPPREMRVMGPPALPSKAFLKRSKSTNTIKLPKRDESVKPGYCESCRVKFNEFNEHVESKKHVKFASNPTNFEALDYVLDRLKRLSVIEVEDRDRLRLAKLKARCMAMKPVMNVG